MVIHFPTTVTLYRKIPDPNYPGRYLKDEYGTFQLEPIEIKVALSLKQNIVKDREGAEVNTFMDVDFPASVEYDYGDELEYTDPFNRTYRGAVITMEENTDPLGIRVLSRFSNIGFQ